MAYTWSFKKQFAKEFSRYPLDQQDKIIAFLDLFEQHGLGNFNLYQGKISPSWGGLEPADPRFSFAKTHHLWHYHIGIPKYVMKHGKYLTSDWVLHFQWKDKGEHINLVDICYHYRNDGTFHLPHHTYLA